MLRAQSMSPGMGAPPSKKVESETPLTEFDTLLLQKLVQLQNSYKLDKDTPELVHPP